VKRIILDLCGGTGSWSKSYVEAGYDVRLITLPDNDVRTYQPPDNVYGILAAPPCTMFSFARTHANVPRDLLLGMETVTACLRIIWECQHRLPAPYSKKTGLMFWALENPNGFLKYFLGRPPFEFNPYDFGDNHKKKTHLWGWYNVPQKNPVGCDKPKFDKLTTKEIYPEFYGLLTRTERRAITPPGFARAFFEANP
jgi:hypothetical protein